MNLAAIIIASLLTIFLLALGYWWYRKNKPRHTFIGVDFGASSIQPRNIRNLFGPFRVKRNDGQRVQFPIPQGYQHPRQDGKGTIFFGDLATGQLFNLRKKGDNIIQEFAHGIFNELALADGRVASIVAATKAGGLKLEHIMMAVGVVAVLVIFNIYQYLNGVKH